MFTRLGVGIKFRQTFAEVVTVFSFFSASRARVS